MMETVILREVPRSRDKRPDKPEFDKVATIALKKNSRRTRLIALGAIAIVILIAAGFTYYSYASGYESTDDAFIEGHISQVSPKVTGHVLTVHVTDNQPVNAGDLLIEIDPRDFQARVAQARAALETSTAQAALARERLAQAEAQVGAAQAEATRAGADERRFAELVRRDLIARQEFDHATADARTTSAQLAAARANEQASAAAIRQADSQVAEARAALGSAELELSYAKIYAALSGRVTRKAVELGALVQPGQALFAIVPNDFWIVANFKETQLAKMRPGQPVEIKIDALRRVRFRGHVDSIQSGAGARFSLLPPENATGNYVKVVQRVPVKIVFDRTDFAAYPLGPGMSVVPKVNVR
jgi:membrane fusion protein (multidrug efflux system)